MCTTSPLSSTRLRNSINPHDSHGTLGKLVFKHSLVTTKGHDLQAGLKLRWSSIRSICLTSRTNRSC
uniref:Putative ovule protein n=1 Tax=Solanum chacoense TaxID=4108 RepID=A0A0V0H261_SOLCH